MGVLTRLRTLLHRDRRRRLLGPWMVANLGYDALHTAVMIGIFNRYGLHPWLYVAYIVVFSLGFAWSSLALVGALVDRRSRAAWALSAVTALCFFAPDLFLITTTRHVPPAFYAVLGVYLTGSTMLAVLTLIRRYRAKRMTQAGDVDPHSPAGSTSSRGTPVVRGATRG